MDNAMRITVNNNVITSPFEHREIKKVERSNFVQVQQKKELEKLKVLERAVFTDKNLGEEFYLSPGDMIYVLGEDTRQPYASKIYNAPNGDSFIIVPAERIIMVERND